MAGTSSSTIFSYSGYQWRSVKGGEVQWPPDGSGFRLHPMNPRSRTQRSNSAALLAGGTPGDCGNWQTPTKLSGYKPQTRLIRSLQTRDHSRLVVSLPTWCAIAEARGEKIVRSVPRS